MKKESSSEKVRNGEVRKQGDRKIIDRKGAGKEEEEGKESSRKKEVAERKEEKKKELSRERGKKGKEREMHG